MTARRAVVVHCDYEGCDATWVGEGVDFATEARKLVPHYGWKCTSYGDVCPRHVHGLGKVSRERSGHA